MNSQLVDKQLSEAEELASQPGRFVVLSFDLEVRTEQGNHLVICGQDGCSCSCDVFRKHGGCSHVVAVSLLLMNDPLFSHCVSV